MIVLAPLASVMLATDQEVVPVAVPLPPALLLHVTEAIPLPLSEAVPASVVSGLVFVLYVPPPAAGALMATAGAVVS